MEKKQLRTALIASGATILAGGFLFSVYLVVKRVVSPKIKEISKAALIDLMNQFKAASQKRVNEIKKQFAEERFPYFEKEDAKYREIIKKFDKVFESLMMEIMNKILKENGYTYEDFKHSFSVNYEDQEVQSNFQNLLSAAGQRADSVQIPESLTMERYEEVMTFHCQKYEELYEKFSGQNSEIISYIQCLVVDEARKKYQFKEEEIEAYSEKYAKDQPIMHRHYQERLNAASIRFVRALPE